eukprot:6181075-Pleurochrysis_carterae.AAC.2
MRCRPRPTRLVAFLLICSTANHPVPSVCPPSLMNASASLSSFQHEEWLLPMLLRAHAFTIMAACVPISFLECLRARFHEICASLRSCLRACAVRARVQACVRSGVRACAVRARVQACVRACVRACAVRARVQACVRACVRACAVRARVQACVRSGVRACAVRARVLRACALACMRAS